MGTLHLTGIFKLANADEHICFLFSKKQTNLKTKKLNKSDLLSRAAFEVHFCS